MATMGKHIRIIAIFVVITAIVLAFPNNVIMMLRIKSVSLFIPKNKFDTRALPHPAYQAT
ncbi:hypothetical protein DSUL_20539 [Desulfovibrionales bacterium]